MNKKDPQLCRDMSEKFVDEIVLNNPVIFKVFKERADYIGEVNIKEVNLLGCLVGKVMRKSKGSTDPGKVANLFLKLRDK